MVNHGAVKDEQQASHMTGLLLVLIKEVMFETDMNVSKCLPEVRI
jgi:hypothetical protein